MTRMSDPYADRKPEFWPEGQTIIVNILKLNLPGEPKTYM